MRVPLPCRARITAIRPAAAQSITGRCHGACMRMISAPVADDRALWRVGDPGGLLARRLALKLCRSRALLRPRRIRAWRVGQGRQSARPQVRGRQPVRGAAPTRLRLLRVRSDIIQHSSSVLVTVEDAGTGIDKKDKDQIFEPFFTRKSKGTGIGLTICRSIVDSHGGSLQVAANDPYGTIFYVTLPSAASE
jgi:hypothetical protein